MRWRPDFRGGCYRLLTPLLAWLLMQAAHEAGHVAGAWLTGGRVVNVVLHPLTISRTDVAPNPMPLVEVWAGPLLGVLLPAGLWIASRRWLPPLSPWLQFFAGFCLIANGAYLGYGVVEPVGDAEELLRHGTPKWLLGSFGLLTIPLGLRLWHRLGSEFGWGPHGQKISWTAVAATLAALLGVTALEVWLSPRG